MNYRQATLLATKDITTAGTEPVDISVSDVISRITAIIELVNDGNNPTNHPLAAMPKIEVIDGSKVVASMTGYAAQAMSYYNTGKMPHNELNYEDNGYARCMVPIDFGRWLYDPDLGLDPKRFKNLQLRVKHNYAFGGCSPDGAYLRVIADLFDQKAASPAGYLLNKEVKTFTPAEGSSEDTSLPVDNNIRKLIIMNVNDNEEPDVQFEDVVIDEEDGKRVIYDCKTMDLIRAASMRFGRFTEYFSGHLEGTTADEFWLSACKDIMLGLVPDAASQMIYYTWSGGRTRTLTPAVSSYFGANVSGRCPHGAVPVFFGMQDDPNDWWEVQNVGKARIKLTPRSVAGAITIDTEKTTDIIIQSLQRY